MQLVYWKQTTAKRMRKVTIVFQYVCTYGEKFDLKNTFIYVELTQETPLY